VHLVGFIVEIYYDARSYNRHIISVGLLSSKTVVMYKTLLTSKVLHFLHVLSDKEYDFLNPLSPELNSICYLLALLAHNFLHVSRIRVKSLTLR
jgi:transposase